MKRPILLILIFTFCLIASIFSKPKSSAAEDDYTWNYITDPFAGPKTRITNDGDEITFQKRADRNTYRVIKNGMTTIEMDFGNRAMFGFYFAETVRYYYIFGGIQSLPNYNNSICQDIPIIIRFEKDLSYFTYVLDQREELDEYVCFLEGVQFGDDTLVLIEKVHGTVANKEYGAQLVMLDETMNFVKFMDLMPTQTHVSVAYDLIHVYGYETNLSAIEYFDKDFNKIEEYKSDETRTGDFMLYENCKVNGKEYLSGSVFSEPGNYALEDGFHEIKHILLEPEIEIDGNLENNMYQETIEYKVSGGSVSINGKSVGLNGKVTKSGKYTISVKGINGYVYEKTVLIAPKMLTKMNEDGTISQGSTINFSGDATLNGETIEDGFVITTPGNYVMRLSVGGEITEEYHFVVPDGTVSAQALTKEDNKMLYFIFGSMLVVATAGIIAMIVVGVRQNRH